MITQYREDALRRALETLHNTVRDVHGSVIVNTDGLLITSYPPGNDRDSPTGGDQVAAMAAVLMGLADRTLHRLAQGDLDRVLIEGHDGILVVLPATRDAALAVLIDKQAKVGLTLLEIKRCAEQIHKILR
ncbi:MAG: roadblock/LC7 domain-containing protein [Chloroflexi bacterium]|nr:roadblock/LC7 domain-containing protein [Chloroflexota bacterium]